MTQRTSWVLLDDLDGSAASVTISFALDGHRYEIDLSDRNAAALRGVFSDYTAAARRGAGRGPAAPRARRPPLTPGGARRRRPEVAAVAPAARASSTVRPATRSTPVAAAPPSPAAGPGEPVGPVGDDHATVLSVVEQVCSILLGLARRARELVAEVLDMVVELLARLLGPVRLAIRSRPGEDRVAAALG